MPCSDGMPPSYSYSDIQDARKEGFENGQKKAAEKLESQIKNVTEKASLLAEKYNQLAPIICTLLRTLARHRGNNVEEVISNLSLPHPQFQILSQFWKEHKVQDVKRMEEQMSSWDLADKEIALSLLKKELDVD